MSAVTPCGGCGAPCAWAWKDDKAEPCWGEVTAVDEVLEADGGWCWIHACSGHAPVWDRKPYLRKDAEKASGNAENQGSKA